eukprot:m.73907 g.73907  ORF g.73907 m.73907 type:complete len:195 (+) comp11786_c0_seq3:69-653(+)
MLGVGEFVFLCGCGLVVIGPKGFPSFARNTGKLVGLSVRFMKRINQGVRNFSKEYQIAEMHKELQSGMSEMQSIREELTSMTTRHSLKQSFLGTNEPPNQSAPVYNESNPNDSPTPPHTQHSSTLPTTASSPTFTSPQHDAHPTSTSTPFLESMLKESAKGVVPTQQEGIAGSDYLHVAIAYHKSIHSHNKHKT